MASCTRMPMCKNANKRLFMLRSLKRFGFSKSGLITVYRGYIRPLLEYSDVINFGILASLLNKPTNLKEFKKELWELFLVLIMFRMLMLWMCVMLIVYQPGGSNIVLSFAQSLPKCSRASKLLPPCRGVIYGRQLWSNAKHSQPRARTNRYASSPIPYYVQLINP